MVETTEGLMEYLERIQEVTIRDEESKKEINNLINQLKTIRIAKSLIWRKLEPLQGKLNNFINDEDYQSLPGAPTKDIENYTGQFDDFMFHTTRETDLISECIIELLNRIDKLVEEQEEEELKKEEEEKTKEEQAEKEIKEEEDNAFAEGD